MDGLSFDGGPVEKVVPALKRLRAEGQSFRLVVVQNDPNFRLDGIDIENKIWSQDTELRDLQSFDIGLAPSFDGELYEGKCGFKQVEYMTTGVPVVSSFVGGVRDFLVHEQNGMVTNTDDDWYQHIKRLIADRALRARLSSHARSLVESKYCANVQGAVVADAVKNAIHSNRVR
ncbi:MAG: glycosyltransferase family 4 protein [Polyangiales bacterium]